MSLRATTGTTPKPDARVTIVHFVPGLRGGVDEAAAYMIDAGDVERFEYETIRTRGSRTALTPLLLLKALLFAASLGFRKQRVIAHINMSSNASTIRKVLICMVLKLVSVPYIVQIHGGGFERYVDSIAPRFVHAIRTALNGAAFVVVLGPEFAPVLFERLGIDRSHVRVIPNGVPGVGTPQSEVHGGRATVVHVGRLSDAKGTFLLLEALGRIPQSGRGWKAVFAGDGGVEEVRRMATELGIVGDVTVLGWQSRESVRDLYRSADIFVLPSATEAMSLALLEAMSAGLACVVTDVGTHRSVVDDGHAGQIVSRDAAAIESAIRELIETPERVSALGTRALDRFNQNYDIATTTEAWHSLYDLVIHQRAST